MALTAAVMMTAFLPKRRPIPDPLM